MEPLKLITLNIEKDKHLGRVLPFLMQQNSDVISLQEVLKDDLLAFKKALGVKSAFAPMKILLTDQGAKEFGVAVLSKYPFEASSEYYVGTQDSLPEAMPGTPTQTNHVALITTITKDDQPYRVINTHFTWTPDGQADDRQRTHLKNLLKILEKLNSFVLVGDFNAPRGREIFSKIAERYKDNLPAFVTTTLDKTYHRAGDLQLVVDGIFSTSNYKVENVQIHEGLSDHKALSCLVRISE